MMEAKTPEERIEQLEKRVAALENEMGILVNFLGKVTLSVAINHALIKDLDEDLAELEYMHPVC